MRKNTFKTLEEQRKQQLEKTEYYQDLKEQIANYNIALSFAVLFLFVAFVIILFLLNALSA